MSDKNTTSYCWLTLTIIFWIVVVGVVIGNARDYGMSWDEYFRWQGGEQKFEYYSALLAGDWGAAASMRGAGDPYPGLFDLSLACWRRVSPLGEVDTGHLYSAFFGLIGIAGTMALGRLIGGPWVGLAAGVLLALFPRYWGHMFINPKDIPFAAMFVWGMWGWLRVLGQPRWLNWRSALLFGILAGCAMAVRIGGLLLFCYAGLFLGLQLLAEWKRREWSRTFLFAETSRLIAWLGLAAVPALLILTLFWPNAHRNPFAATAQTLSSVTSFGWEGKVLYRGEYLAASDIPWHYLPTWVGMVTPVLWYYITLTAIIGVIFCCRREGFAREPVFRVGALIFGAIFPVAYIILNDSTVYDGMRHVLFIIPLLAALMGLGMVFSARVLMGYAPRWALVAWAVLLVIGIADIVYTMTRLHPYQYTFFNRWSGGLSGAVGNFDTDYWGTAYREAAEILSQELPPRDPAIGPWRVTMEPPLELLVERFGKPVIPPPGLVTPYLANHMVLVSGNEAPELYLATTRNDYHAMRPGPVVLAVGRSGVTFAEVRALGAWNLGSDDQ